jgi:uncharacterized protein
MDKILYHAGCHDGFCAAWLCHKVWPNAEYIPVQYNQPPPDVRGASVLIVDFSYPRDVLIAMRSTCKQTNGQGELAVLDHHKTAQADLEGLDWCVFDMDKSGARLTWEFLWDNGLIDPIKQFGTAFLDRSASPMLVDYTEDRDLWRWKLPSSREINAALRSYPLDLDLWNRLNRCCEHLAAEGTAILREQQRLIDQHVGFARLLNIAGHEVYGVNATCHVSEIAQELAKRGPFGACWFENANGDKVYSLRSTEESGVDVSAIAKQLGGGGHARAAGFTEKRT